MSEWSWTQLFLSGFLGFVSILALPSLKTTQTSSHSNLNQTSIKLCGIQVGLLLIIENKKQRNVFFYLHNFGSDYLIEMLLIFRRKKWIG